MSKVCLYVDYCIANEEDAKEVFGIEADNTDINTGIAEKIQLWKTESNTET